MPNARKNQRHRREQRRADAQQRQAAYDSLSIQEKVARSLSRGHDGTAEYRRLHEQELGPEGD